MPVPSEACTIIIVLLMVLLMIVMFFVLILLVMVLLMIILFFVLILLVMVSLHVPMGVAACSLASLGQVHLLQVFLALCMGGQLGTQPSLPRPTSTLR
jgi:hypothetical protein